jgi:hypothetical protein
MSNTSKHELLFFSLLLLVIFALLDPDPVSESGSGSGSTYPIESGSATLVQVMDACLRCQSETKVDARGGKDCVVVWGECNHSFHQARGRRIFFSQFSSFGTVLH